VNRRLAALVALAALALGACSQPGGTSATSSSSAASPSATATTQVTGLPGFYAQQIDWTPCRSDDLCGKLTVPLDYANPDGQTISLALLKVPATGDAIGSLVVNPGGPGGSGIEYAAAAKSYFGSKIRSSYDIVGFDPRGVGQSDPLQCESDAQLDELVASDPDPETAAEVAKSNALITQLGNACLTKSGDLARHMSTVEVAKDMDILRAALGEDKLTYFGASYGTFLGATYADLFPDKVGRMVLDGALDPSLSTLQISLAQAHGFEVALRAYVANCTQKSDCFLGGSVDQGVLRIQQFLTQVDTTPLPGDGERQLQIGNAVLGIWLPLYVKDYWPLLDNALQSAFKGDGRQLLALSDAYVSRGPSGYIDNSIEALYAVNCLDHDDGIPASKVARYLPQFTKASPTWGRIFDFGLTACADWPIHSGVVGHELHAVGAPPIVVIGTTRDPATPLAWAQALASQLDSGTLITRDGDGHTGYDRGNSCVDDAVESYLVDGVDPPPDLYCADPSASS
jgi:pimeloyl-ACP methyl ester carboxylesterase